MEGKVLKDEVSFKLEGIKLIGVVKAVYTGKLKGDTIEFKVQAERNGKKIQAGPGFKAKRVATDIDVGK